MQDFDEQVPGSTTTESGAEPGFSDIILGWLRSLKLTIFLLILLAALSILGTVIPQNLQVQEYLRFYSPMKTRLYFALGLLDMYHSWWFITLLGLLALNLLACTWRRTPAILRRISGSRPLLTDRLADSCPLKTVFHAPRSPEDCLTEARNILGGKFKKINITVTGGVFHLSADRGGYSRLGVLITHASVLIILLGAMVGSIFGFKAYVNITEGESTDRVFLQKSSEPLRLGFMVRCDKFSVSFYRDGTPKDYRSSLVVLEGGKEILKQDVRVNHPLVYKGVTFYQSSYGISGPPLFDLEFRRNNAAAPVVKKVEFQQAFSLGSGDSGGSGERKFRVDDYRESVMGRGPALRIVHFKDLKRAGDFWVFLNDSTTRELDGDSWTIAFNGAYQPRFTGLQVARDPGVRLVWIGCGLIVIGMIIALFTAHKMVWLRITPDNGGSQLFLAGKSSRNIESFRKEFEGLAASFSSTASEKAVDNDI